MAGVTLTNSSGGSRSHQRPERYRQNMKKSLLKKTSWILFLSALVAFATGASPVWAKPALWKLSDPDTTIYLFGTVHLLKAQTQWFDPDLKAAFESSNELVVELVEPDPAEFNRVLLHRAVDVMALHCPASCPRTMFSIIRKPWRILVSLPMPLTLLEKDSSIVEIVQSGYGSEAMDGLAGEAS